MDHLRRLCPGNLCHPGLEVIKHRPGCCNVLCLQVDPDPLPSLAFPRFHDQVHGVRVLLEIGQRAILSKPHDHRLPSHSGRAEEGGIDIPRFVVVLIVPILGDLLK